MTQGVLEQLVSKFNAAADGIYNNGTIMKLFNSVLTAYSPYKPKRGYFYCFIEAVYKLFQHISLEKVKEHGVNTLASWVYSLIFFKKQFFIVLQLISSS